MSNRSRLLSMFTVAVFALPLLAQAQNVAPSRIRGTVAAASGGDVEVLTREGKKLTLHVSDSTRYSSVKSLDLSAIKQGSFIGTAGKPTANGGIQALEVVVFPEEARGAGEGHYDWDLLPGSSMTNATVSAVVSDNAGRDLNLTYQGKDIKIQVPKDVPVVTFVPATLQDVKPGLAVFAVATRGGDDWNAARIVVEKDGVKPPM
ncbi:hypothetical protein [Herbaspirillum sp. RV1423]|uniref:hypothetical protein n=1 Tax=Herbaspirillum sp. RV1423 TaxID=1443993 RepID=UPI0004B0504F|nr:hypothetical protein [Herbaspirillum sp. RV1423]